MSTGRILATILVLLAGLETGSAAARLHAPEDLHGGRFIVLAQAGQQTAQGSQRAVIAPSMALSLALRYSPGSQGLDVTLVERGRPMYAVKLKTGNRVHRVLVDALTGEILGE